MKAIKCIPLKLLRTRGRENSLQEAIQRRPYFPQKRSVKPSADNKRELNGIHAVGVDMANPRRSRYFIF